MEWQHLSDAGLRLYLALKELTTTNDIPLTLESVCDTYGIPRMQALSAIKELEEAGFVKKGKGTLRLPEDKRTIHFRTSSPDRVDELEKQVLDLKRQLKARVLGETSGLAEALLPDERLLVVELERQRGRGLTIEEAYFLGKCISGWGIERTRTLIQQKSDADNPMKVAYIMLKRGARGKQFEQKPEARVKYRERVSNED